VYFCRPTTPHNPGEWATEGGAIVQLEGRPTTSRNTKCFQGAAQNQNEHWSLGRTSPALLRASSSAFIGARPPRLTTVRVTPATRAGRC